MPEHGLQLSRIKSRFAFMSEPRLIDRLAANTIHLWIVALNASKGESPFEILSEEERARTSRFVRECDRERYAVSHGALRRILARYCGIRPEQVCLAIGE